ncbi:MAG: GNAT family N-acetyltransferase [Casimicrobium sp.]
MNTSHHVSFRTATKDDAMGVASLVERTFTMALVPGWSIESLRSIHEENSAEALAVSFAQAAYQRIAIVEEKIIGYINFSKPHLLSIIAVDASQHRRGIGARLLLDAIEAIDKAYLDIELLQLSATELSQPFYAKHGFYPISPMLNVGDRRFVRMAMWLRPRRMDWT